MLLSLTTPWRILNCKVPRHDRPRIIIWVIFGIEHDHISPAHLRPQRLLPVGFGKSASLRKAEIRFPRLCHRRRQETLRSTPERASWRRNTRSKPGELRLPPLSHYSRWDIRFRLRRASHRKIESGLRRWGLFQRFRSGDRLRRLGARASLDHCAQIVRHVRLVCGLGARQIRERRSVALDQLA